MTLGSGPRSLPPPSPSVPTIPTPRAKRGPVEEGLERARPRSAPARRLASRALGSPRFDLERALYGLCHWHGPRTGGPHVAWAPACCCPETRSWNSARAERWKVFARWQTLFRASLARARGSLPLASTIGVRAFDSARELRAIWPACRGGSALIRGYRDLLSAPWDRCDRRSNVAGTRGNGRRGNVLQKAEACVSRGHSQGLASGASVISWPRWFSDLETRFAVIESRFTRVRASRSRAPCSWRIQALTGNSIGKDSYTVWRDY